MSEPRYANVSVCERQGASRRFLCDRRQPPAASAVPLTTSHSEPQGASRGFLSAERTPEPAASAVPLTEARP